MFDESFRKNSVLYKFACNDKFSSIVIEKPLKKQDPALFSKLFLRYTKKCDKNINHFSFQDVVCNDLDFRKILTENENVKIIKSTIYEDHGKYKKSDILKILSETEDDDDNEGALENYDDHGGCYEYYDYIIDDFLKLYDEYLTIEYRGLNILGNIKGLKFQKLKIHVTKLNEFSIFINFLEKVSCNNIIKAIYFDNIDETEIFYHQIKEIDKNLKIRFMKSSSIYLSDSCKVVKYMQRENGIINTNKFYEEDLRFYLFRGNLRDYIVMNSPTHSVSESFDFSDRFELYETYQGVLMLDSKVVTMDYFINFYNTQNGK